MLYVTLNDDVLVTGSTVEEHLSNLCDSTEYLEHKIDAKGLHTTDDKVKAVQNAPLPKIVRELRSS